MKRLLLFFLLLGLGAQATPERSLTLVVDYYRTEDKVISTLTDLADLSPQATLSFQLRPGVEQLVKSSINGVVVSAKATLTPNDGRYRIKIEIEAVETGQGVLPVQTKFGANGDFVTDLYQSHLAGRSTSSSRRDEAEPLRMTYRAWRVSLEP
jgi:hypothetical protein